MEGKSLPMATSSQPKSPSRRLPDWFRTSLPSGEQQATFNATKSAVKDNKLHTVCEEARCPNIHECWASGDATFMIAGQECTRVDVDFVPLARLNALHLLTQRNHNTSLKPWPR